MKKQSNEKYKIKVNRVSSESENIFPYNKYLKNNYSQITKIAPKNSILYKVKYKPEIIINEYHQTSNNINTNINIKTNRSINNPNLNDSRNNFCFSGQTKNFSFNRGNDEYIYDSSIKDEDNNKDYNNNKNDNNDKPLRNSDYINNKINKTEKILNDNNSNSNSSVIFSPFSNGYSVQSRESDYKKKNLKYIKDIKYDTISNKYNRKFINFIFQSPHDSKINNNIQVNSERYNTGNLSNNNFVVFENINSRYGKNTIDAKKTSKEKITVSNALDYKKYKKRKNPSMNLNSLYNKTNPDGSESSIESFRTKKINKMNNIIFSSASNINNIFGTRKTKNSNNNIIIHTNSYDNTISNNNDNTKETLNLKLEHYRIKLFKEFMKHFQIFYKSYIKNNFDKFLNNIKNYKKKINNNKSFIYSKKNYLKNCSIENNSTHRKKHISKLSNGSSFGTDLIDIFKSSSMKDYYKLYNQLRKNKNLNQSINQINRIFNSYSFNNDITDSNKMNKKNNSIFASSRSKNILNSAPRINKILNNLSVKRNQENKSNVQVNSKSPSFRIGNDTIINNKMKYGNDRIIKENELFRDSKELNKKYEQIQRRRLKSKVQSKYKDLPSNRSIVSNKSVDKIKNTDEYNQFNELRKYIQSVRKENNLREKSLKTLNSERNKKNIFKNKHLIRISALDDNSNSEDYDNNENNNNYNENIDLNYNKTFYDYHFNKDKKQNEYEDNNIKKNDEQNSMIGMINKKKIGFSPNNRIINTNSISNKYNNLIHKKINNIFNNNSAKNSQEKSYKRVKVNPNKSNNDKSYKKVKVNINKKYITEGYEKNNKSKKNNNIINYNNKFKFNSNNDLKTNTKSKINNSTHNKNNFYNKNNISFNDNIIGINKNESTLIKNICTRDHRIHININYYEFKRKNFPYRMRYIFLHKSDTISISLFGDINKFNTLFSKLQFRLSSIQEEENSVQNSKYYDEIETFGKNNNFYLNDSKKNYVLYHNNGLLYGNFIDILENILLNLFKKKFIYKMKSINQINNIFLNHNYEHSINNEKNENNTIYNKKRGVIGKKSLGETSFSESTNKIKRKKYIKRNLNYLIYKEKIQKFRNKLIKFICFSK